ncbi:MAG: DUF5777 family beta-barrel protein [Bacteroidota bacterium]
MYRLLYFLLIAAFLPVNNIVAQKHYDKVQQTFKDTRVINTHSVETLPKRRLDIRIGHRFGDLKGGWPTLYGLENAADIMLGGAYGITNNLSIGLHRTKGSGPLSRLLTTTLKYRALHQSDNGMPISLTLVGMASASTMGASDAPDALNNFSKFAHRLIYAGQILVARKISDGLSVQIVPSYIHRNIVPFNDENGLFSIGGAARIQLSKVVGIIVDGTFPLSDLRTAGNDYFPALGIGFEFDTGGHVFQVNFTNATAIMETDYIPNTRTSWGDGEIRLGFTISRTFNL